MILANLKPGSELRRTAPGSMTQTAPGVGLGGGSPVLRPSNGWTYAQSATCAQVSHGQFWSHRDPRVASAWPLGWIGQEGHLTPRSSLAISSVAIPAVPFSAGVIPAGVIPAGEGNPTASLMSNAAPKRSVRDVLSEGASIPTGGRREG